MKVLISLLGLSPGVVTGAYYAMYYGWGIDPVQIDKVVSVGTSAKLMDLIESEIENEFGRWRSRSGIQVQYDRTSRYHIDGEDLRDENDVDQFRKIILRLLREDYRNDDIYMVVAGGRKSMAALSAVAAQLYGYGVKGMYHLYIEKNLEDDGSSDRFWNIDLKRQQEVLHPPKGKCGLVHIPYLQFKGKEGEISLAIRGEVQDYIIQYLEENPSFIPCLEKNSYGNVLGYMFEVKVMEYLRQKEGYSNASHHYSFPGHSGDVDVFAEKDGNILICECRLFLNYDPERHSVEAKKVRQIVDRMIFLREKYKDIKIEAWVVSNAKTAQDDAWDLATQWDIKMMTTGPIESRFKTTLYDWRISRILPMDRNQDCRDTVSKI